MWYRGVDFPWESAGPADSMGFVLRFINILLICSNPSLPLDSRKTLAAWTRRISSRFSCPNRTFELEEAREPLQMSRLEKKPQVAFTFLIIPSHPQCRACVSITRLHVTE